MYILFLYGFISLPYEALLSPVAFTVAISVWDKWIRFRMTFTNIVTFLVAPATSWLLPEATLRSIMSFLITLVTHRLAWRADRGSFVTLNEAFLLACIDTWFENPSARSELWIWLPYSRYSWLISSSLKGYESIRYMLALSHYDFCSPRELKLQQIWSDFRTSNRSPNLAFSLNFASEYKLSALVKKVRISPASYYSDTAVSWFRILSFVLKNSQALPH